MRFIRKGANNQFQIGDNNHVAKKVSNMEGEAFQGTVSKVERTEHDMKMLLGMVPHVQEIVDIKALPSRAQHGVNMTIVTASPSYIEGVDEMQDTMGMKTKQAPLPSQEKKVNASVERSDVFAFRIFVARG